MQTQIKDIVKVASIYMATIIGAGFASGQEIMQFFSTYYEGGFYGIILAGILFAVIGYIVLNKVYSERIRNYEEFLFPCVGWFLGWVMEILVTIFMAFVLCIMISGMAGILEDSLGLPLYIAVMCVAFVCMVIFLTDLKGIIALSTIVTPLLTIGMLGVGLYIIINKYNPVFNMGDNLGNMTHNWVFSSLLYVSYNSIIGVVVMCSLLPYLKTKKTASMGGVLGGIMLSLIALTINFALYLFYPEIKLLKFPVISIVSKYSYILGIFYTYLLLSAMLISAITAGYGLIERVKNKIGISRKLIILFVCGLSIPLSNIGFLDLISTVYPIFGYIGIFMVFIILFQGINLIRSTFTGDECNRKKRALKTK